MGKLTPGIFPKPDRPFEMDLNSSARAILLAIWLGLWLGLPAGEAKASDPFSALMTFPVTDERSEFTAGIGRDIVLHAQRAKDAQGRSFGWEFLATDRRLSNPHNFFEGCLCGHGPQPDELYAWHFIERYFPPERILTVFGYPLEVRVRCVDCQTAGSGGSDAYFTAGTVDVSWRRLPAANPRQSRISDIVKPTP